MALVNKLTAIGDAIRNKNGSTSKLTLDSMVTAINDMADVTIDGVKVKEKLDLISNTIFTQSNLGSMAYSFKWGSSVTLNNEIHILGGSDNASKHYKWNGSSWISVSKLPYSFEYGDAVVFNDEIHIFGTHYSVGTTTNHYKWNGFSWTSVSTLPSSNSCGDACIFDNSIFMGKENDIYKWDGTSWILMGSKFMSFINGCLEACDNAIYSLGGSSYPTNFNLIVLSYYKKVG